MRREEGARAPSLRKGEKSMRMQTRGFSTREDAQKYKDWLAGQGIPADRIETSEKVKTIGGFRVTVTTIRWTR